MMPRASPNRSAYSPGNVRRSSATAPQPRTLDRPLRARSVCSSTTSRPSTTGSPKPTGAAPRTAEASIPANGSAIFRTNSGRLPPIGSSPASGRLPRALLAGYAPVPAAVFAATRTSVWPTRERLDATRLCQAAVPAAAHRASRRWLDAYCALAASLARLVAQITGEMTGDAQGPTWLVIANGVVPATFSRRSTARPPAPAR